MTNSKLIKSPEEAIETIKANMPTSGYQMLREALDMAIEALKRECWIPVKERLPEDRNAVLCTDGSYIYLTEYDADLDSAFGDMDEITAWMPLPEPYRPEKG